MRPRIASSSSFSYGSCQEVDARRAFLLWWSTRGGRPQPSGVARVSGAAPGLGEVGIVRRASFHGFFLKASWFSFPGPGRWMDACGPVSSGWRTAARLRGTLLFARVLKARLQFDCSLQAQSSGGMSGSNSSAGQAQGRSTNARHSQKSSFSGSLPCSSGGQCFRSFRRPLRLPSGRSLCHDVPAGLV